MPPVTPTLSSSAALEVVVTTTFNAVNGDEVGIITTLGFQCIKFSGNSGYGLSQWQTTLQCNVVSHCLIPYLEWSLNFNLHALSPCYIVPRFPVKISRNVSWISLQWRIISTMMSQITSVSIVYLIFCSGADQRKYQSPASLAFVSGIHRWPVNSPHKGPVTRKMFSFDDVTY